VSKDVPSRPIRTIAERGDSYLLVFLAIVLTIIASAFAEPGTWGALIAGLMMFVTLWIALETSGVRRRRIIIYRYVALGLILLMISGRFLGYGPGESAVYFTTMAILIVGAQVSIGKRIVDHPIISARTLMGALSIYLLLGLLCAYVYHAMDLMGGQFFVQTDAPRPFDFIYYSFITLTTVGYGDYTPAMDFGRAIAITEALIGQIYLVTVVALTVTNLGRERSNPSLREKLEAAREGQAEGQAALDAAARDADPNR